MRQKWDVKLLASFRVPHDVDGAKAEAADLSRRGLEGATNCKQALHDGRSPLVRNVIGPGDGSMVHGEYLCCGTSKLPDCVRCLLVCGVALRNSTRKLSSDGRKVGLQLTAVHARRRSLLIPCREVSHLRFQLAAPGCSSEQTLILSREVGDVRFHLAALRNNAQLSLVEQSELGYLCLQHTAPRSGT